MFTQLLALLLVATVPDAAPVAEKESRWNPPISGTFLGVQGQVRDGRFLIRSIGPGSAAEAAGLRRGDAMVRIGQENGFGNFDDFTRAVEGLRPGLPVEVLISRSGKNVPITLVPDHGAFRDLFSIVDRLRSSRFITGLPEFQRTLSAITSLDADRLRKATRWSGSYEILNQAVSRLGLSHMAVVPPWTYEHLFSGAARSRGAFRLGVLLARTPAAGPESGQGGSEYFVLQVINESPADRAGLALGDEVVRINGIPVDRSPRRVLAGFESVHPYFLIQVDQDEEILLETRRRRNDDVQGIRVRVDRRVSDLESTLKSLRVFEDSGRILAYIHLWNFMSPELPRLLREVLESGEAGGAEGLLIDLRGRGGRVDVLNRLLGILGQESRPRVFLIDRDTRSAKEILAHRLRGQPRIVLVGQRTAGAVLPAAMQPLSRGAALMFPIEPRGIRRLIGDEPLEGVGVAPDVEVPTRLPYSEGADPILEKGRQVLLDLLDSVPRRRRF